MKGLRGHSPHTATPLSSVPIGPAFPSKHAQPGPWDSDDHALHSLPFADLLSPFKWRQQEAPSQSVSERKSASAPTQSPLTHTLPRVAPALPMPLSSPPPDLVPAGSPRRFAYPRSSPPHTAPTPITTTLLTLLVGDANPESPPPAPAPAVVFVSPHRPSPPHWPTAGVIRRPQGDSPAPLTHSHRATQRKPTVADPAVPAALAFLREHARTGGADTDMRKHMLPEVSELLLSESVGDVSMTVTRSLSPESEDWSVPGTVSVCVDECVSDVATQASASSSSSVSVCGPVLTSVPLPSPHTFACSTDWLVRCDVSRWRHVPRRSYDAITRWRVFSVDTPPHSPCVCVAGLPAKQHSRGVHTVDGTALSGLDNSSGLFADSHNVLWMSGVGTVARLGPAPAVCGKCVGAGGSFGVLCVSPPHCRRPHANTPLPSPRARLTHRRTKLPSLSHIHTHSCAPLPLPPYTDSFL